MSASLEELYEVRDVALAETPRQARILASLDCDRCREPTMESRLRRLDGALLCPPCFDQAAAGATPVPSPSSGTPATVGT